MQIQANEFLTPRVIKVDEKSQTRALISSRLSGLWSYA